VHCDCDRVQVLLTDEFIDKMLADVSDISDVEEVSFRLHVYCVSSRVIK